MGNVRNIYKPSSKQLAKTVCHEFDSLSKFPLFSLAIPIYYIHTLFLMVLHCIIYLFYSVICEGTNHSYYWVLQILKIQNYAQLLDASVI